MASLLRRDQGRHSLVWSAGLLSLSVLLGLGWWLGAARPAACQRMEDNHIGAHRCRGCHTNAYKIWARSAHARGYQLLPPQQRKNPTCLRCHSTGSAPHLRGVQCESCHGPGRYYIIPEVMIDPLLARTVGLKVTRGPAGCKSCHTKASFHYQKSWAKIAHGKKKK